MGPRAGLCWDGLLLPPCGLSPSRRLLFASSPGGLRIPRRQRTSHRVWASACLTLQVTDSVAKPRFHVGRSYTRSQIHWFLGEHYCHHLPQPLKHIYHLSQLIWSCCLLLIEVLCSGADQVNGRLKDKRRWASETDWVDQRRWKPKPEVGETEKRTGSCSSSLTIQKRKAPSTSEIQSTGKAKKRRMGWKSVEEALSWPSASLLLPDTVK